jgi:hypothetical protein
MIEAGGPAILPMHARPRAVPPRRLREHGYVDGQNLTVEARWAEGRSERFPELIGGETGHLPVEQATNFELVNLKTARPSASRSRRRCWRGQIRS